MFGSFGWNVLSANTNGSFHPLVEETAPTPHPVEVVPVRHRESHHSQSLTATGDAKDSPSLQNHIVDPAAEPARTNKQPVEPVPRTLTGPLAPSSPNQTGQYLPSEDTLQKQFVPQVLSSVVVSSAAFEPEIEEGPVHGTHADKPAPPVETGNRTLVKVEHDMEESELITAMNTSSRDDGHFSGNGEVEITSEFMPVVTLSADDDVTDEYQSSNYSYNSVLLSHNANETGTETLATVSSSELYSVTLLVVTPTSPTVRMSVVQDTITPFTSEDAPVSSTVSSSNFQVPLSKMEIEKSQNNGNLISPSFVSLTESVVGVTVSFTETFYTNTSTLGSRNSTEESLLISTVLDDDGVVINSSTISGFSDPISSLNVLSNWNSHFSELLLTTPVLRASASTLTLSTSGMYPTTVSNESPVLSSMVAGGQNILSSNDLLIDFVKISNSSQSHLNTPGINPTKSSVTKSNDSNGHLNSLRGRNLGVDAKVAEDTGRKAFSDSSRATVTASHSNTIEVEPRLYQSRKPDTLMLDETNIRLSSTAAVQSTSSAISSSSYFPIVLASSLLAKSTLNDTRLDSNILNSSTTTSHPTLANITTANTDRSSSSSILTEQPNWTQSETIYVTKWKDKQTLPSVDVQPSHALPTMKIPLTYLSITMQCSWAYFCARYENLQEFLARHLSNEMKYPIKDSQVMFFDTNACNHITETELNDTARSTIVVPLYIVDQSGDYSRTLTENLGLVIRRNGLNGFWDNITLHDVILAVHFHSTTAPSDITQKPSPAENDMGIIAAVTISCIAGVSLLLLCVLLAVLKRRHGLTKQARRCRKVTDAYSLDSISIYSSFYKRRLRASKRSYLNHGFEDPQAPANKLTYSGMVNFYSNEEDVIEEYKKIPMTVAKLEDLPPGADVKNRYANVIPFPETRVQLSEKSEDPSTEYINANYVRGYLGDQRVYIGCQAPLESTIVDFWEMVWENQSKVIIMLTALQEDGVEKCAPYFAESAAVDSHRLFGDYQVTTKKVDAREVLTISFLQLKNLEKNLMREVVHFWYTAWPSQSVPSDSVSIIDMLLEARPMMKVNPGPNIVHCSPGTGRTGTVIAIDICMQEYESTRSVDVPQCVYRLRRDRGGLVQTSEQYLYIYKTLIEYASRIINQSGRSSLRSTK